MALENCQEHFTFRSDDEEDCQFVVCSTHQKESYAHGTYWGSLILIINRKRQKDFFIVFRATRDPRQHHRDDSHSHPSCAQKRCIRLHHWWSLCSLYLHACQVSYRRRLKSLLCLCDVFWVLINSPVGWFCTGCSTNSCKELTFTYTLYRVIQAMQQQWQMAVWVLKSLVLESTKQGIPNFDQEYIFLRHIPSLKTEKTRWN